MRTVLGKGTVKIGKETREVLVEEFNYDDRKTTLQQPLHTAAVCQLVCNFFQALVGHQE